MTCFVAQEAGEKIQADELIQFRQLRPKVPGGEDVDDDVVADIARATGNMEVQEVTKKLNKIIQLTGFSDTVYAEAYVTVHQYDIVLDVLVLNQTAETLTNLCIELATMGDLKLCERPQNYTLGPYDSKQIKASIKVSSTETVRVATAAAAGGVAVFRCCLSGSLNSWISL